MTRYKITNTSNVGRSYVNDQRQRISFEPGQTKRLASRPSKDDAWIVEEIEEPEKSEETEGGEE